MSHRLQRTLLAPLAAALALTLAPAHAAPASSGPAHQESAHQESAHNELAQRGTNAKKKDRIFGATTLNAGDLTKARANADMRKVIAALDTDIIAWQEAQDLRQVYANKNMPAHWRTAFFTKRSKSGKNWVARELAISWDRRTFRLVKNSKRAIMAHHGRSKSPEVPYPFPNRWTTRVVLKHRLTGQRVSVLNLHANHRTQVHDKGRCGQVKKTVNARLAKKHFAKVAKQVQRQKSTFTLVLGDFNVDHTCDRRVRPKGFPAARFRGVLASSFQRLGTPKLGTHHKRHIDYVFKSVGGRPARFLSHRVLPGPHSDHNAYNVRMKFRK